MKKKGIYNSSNNSGYKYNKSNRNQSKYYNKKHKFSPSCFNNCVEWILNVSFSQDKINYSHVSKYIKINLN